MFSLSLLSLVLFDSLTLNVDQSNRLYSLKSYNFSFSLLDTLLMLSRSHTLSLCLSLSLSLFLSRSFSRSFSPALFSLALSLSLSTFFSLSLSLFIYVHILVNIHADVERGMAEEHLLQKDSNEGFSTSNYGVRYSLFTPVCNKFAPQTQLLSSPFDLLK
jgi:hypothetical protein